MVILFTENDMLSFGEFLFSDERLSKLSTEEINKVSERDLQQWYQLSNQNEFNEG